MSTRVLFSNKKQHDPPPHFRREACSLHAPASSSTTASPRAPCVFVFEEASYRKNGRRISSRISSLSEVSELGAPSSETSERDEIRDEIRRPFFLYDASSKTKTHGALGDAVVLEDAGACSEHASRRKCGGGSCCFLLLKSTRVLILHSSGTRACLFPSPYVDAHGEEDEHMRRGRPLFLDEARARLLETLWASGALEHDSRATGASRLGGEWY